jgi:hypothetical protein
MPVFEGWTLEHPIGVVTFIGLHKAVERIFVIIATFSLITNRPSEFVPVLYNERVVVVEQLAFLRRTVLDKTNVRKLESSL